MKRGFSFSTAVLVAVLLGVVVWVGRIVNPPAAPGGHDHDHGGEAQDAAPKSQSPPSPADMAAHKAEMEKQQKMQMAQMKTRMAEEQKKQTKAAKMPHVDAMDATYWQSHAMGASAAKPDEKPH